MLKADANFEVSTLNNDFISKADFEVSSNPLPVNTFVSLSASCFLTI